MKNLFEIRKCSSRSILLSRLVVLIGILCPISLQAKEYNCHFVDGLTDYEVKLLSDLSVSVNVPESLIITENCSERLTGDGKCRLAIPKNEGKWRWRFQAKKQFSQYIRVMNLRVPWNRYQMDLENRKVMCFVDEDYVEVFGSHKICYDEHAIIEKRKKEIQIKRKQIELKRSMKLGDFGDSQ